MVARTGGPASPAQAAGATGITPCCYDNLPVLNSARAGRRAVSHGGPRVRERIEHFLGYLATERGLSNNTITAYGNDLRQFAQYVESNQVVWLNGDHATGDQDDGGRGVVLGFLSSLKDDNGYAPATVARKMAAVKSLYHYLRKQGAIASDPTADLGTPQVKKPLPRAVGVQEVHALLAQAEQRQQPDGVRDWAMLELLYATGMRVTEVVSLDVSDLDLERGTVRCTGRGARVRMIPVDAGAVCALRAYLGGAREALARPNPAGPGLFLNHRGQRLTRQGFWLIMKELAGQAGITVPITPHMLRHSFAAHRLHDGLALQRLKEILGHASISTTQVYAQLRVEGWDGGAALGASLASAPAGASSR
ncbi:MAG: tyrosine-type recombinase/integrase [Chloroflexi bacterium]|nr:tyrosine-type recombinase/integrase [Chloroflexota bacterium]